MGIPNQLASLLQFSSVGVVDILFFLPLSTLAGSLHIVPWSRRYSAIPYTEDRTLSISRLSPTGGSIHCECLGNETVVAKFTFRLGATSHTHTTA